MYIIKILQFVIMVGNPPTEQAPSFVGMSEGIRVL
jgi:hypothetical protein